MLCRRRNIITSMRFMLVFFISNILDQFRLKKQFEESLDQRDYSEPERKLLSYNIYNIKCTKTSHVYIVECSFSSVIYYRRVVY